VRTAVNPNARSIAAVENSLNHAALPSAKGLGPTVTVTLAAT
jgi:hypothetical protein